MTKSHTTRRAALALTAMLAGAALPAFAQGESAASFPSKPIRVVVPFAAGGGNDIFARLVGAKVSEILGQQLIIENRPAAGGRVAAEFVTQQAPDGYTLFVGASGVMSIAAAIYPNLAYHPTKSFIPLTMIANFPLIVTSPIDLPPKTVSELVAYAKANPDKSNYATTSPAFTVSTELLKLKTGMPAIALPVKSSSEMIQCVIRKDCLLAIVDGPPTIPQVKDGRLRALAVTGAERSPELPDVPSMAEAGYPEVNTKLWAGFFAPVGTPPAIAKKLEQTIQTAIKDPGVSSKLKGMAVNPGGNSSDEFRKMIDADIESYTATVKAANLKFE
ncbi:MAG: extra-cytoplasmic solute receptor [Hyphomicrobiales bacterium]|nr:extra-cytoplasmic solute receptor [Hyphomicrobiales bacterium]